MKLALFTALEDLLSLWSVELSLLLAKGKSAKI